mgnify:FL=1
MTADYDRDLCGYSANPPGPNEHGDFLYDSDFYGDELRFWKALDGHPHLIVPYSLTNNDGKMVG